MNRFKNLRVVAVAASLMAILLVAACTPAQFAAFSNGSVGAKTSVPALQATQTPAPAVVHQFKGSQPTSSSDGQPSMVSSSKFPVIDLADFTGEILTVKSRKEWDSANSLTCSSLHLAPFRSTEEGGPKSSDFAHRELELRCLNPGTDLFDIENADNGFVMVSIAIKGSAKLFTYSAGQQRELDSLVAAKTTDGDTVIRMYVYMTDFFERHLGPPKVSLDPWHTSKERKKYEKKKFEQGRKAAPGANLSDRYRATSTTMSGGTATQQQGQPSGLHATGVEGSGLLSSCMEGTLTVHAWDFGSLPTNMQQTVVRAEKDGRRHFVSGNSFSDLHGKKLRAMAVRGEIRRTSKNSAVRMSIINPDGNEGESHTFRLKDGMVWAKFSNEELPKGSMVRVMVSDEFMSPSRNPESRRREMRLVSWQGLCEQNMHMVSA